MRKGFFLTESEKKRISVLYGGNKLFLFEATAPMPTNVQDQIKFADWMDQNHPNWITKNNGTKVNSTGTKIRRENTWASSGSFQRAWNTYGDTYLQQTGTSNDKNTGVNQGTLIEDKEWGYWDKTDKKRVCCFTLSQMKDLISSGTVTDDTFVSHKDITQNNYVKAWQVKELGIPKAPSDDKNQPIKQGNINDIGGTPSYFGRSKPSTTGSTPTQGQPNLGKSGQFSLDGFKEWYKTYYKIDPETSQLFLDRDKKSMQVKDASGNFINFEWGNDGWKIPKNDQQNIVIYPPEGPKQ